MGITSNIASYYDASVKKDIYMLLGVGSEWDQDHRVYTDISKPKILTKAAGSGAFIQSNVKNPRIGSNESGDITFAGRELNVANMMVRVPMTPSDWKDDFPEFQPKGTSVDLKENPQILKASLDLIKSKVAGEISDLEAQGDTSLTSPSQLRYTDGLIKQMGADADVIDYANVGVITKTNVLGIIAGMEKLISHRLRVAGKKSKVKIAMSWTTFDLANEANRDSQQNGTLLTTPDVTKSAKGYEFLPKASMPDNVIFITIVGTGKDTNLAKGVWFAPDETNFAIYKEQIMDEDWVIGLKFSAGFNYVAGEDIVLYQGS